MGPGGWQGLAQQQDGEQQQQQQAKDRRWDQWVVLNDPELLGVHGTEAELAPHWPPDWD